MKVVHRHSYICKCLFYAHKMKAIHKHSYYTFAVDKSHLGRQLRTVCNEYCETCSMCVVRGGKMYAGEGTCVAYADVCIALCIVFHVDSCFELQWFLVTIQTDFINKYAVLHLHLCPFLFRTPFWFFCSVVLFPPKHLFLAPSSKLCQNWWCHWTGIL